MKNILIKALMKCHNDFFKMTAEEQDVWKLQEHDEIDENVRAFVKKTLGYDDDSSDHKELYEFNIIMLEYNGIGDNKFMLNEFDWDNKILDHDSLYDYNTHYHNEQERYSAEDENFPDHEPTALYNRFAAWARAEVDGKFHYLNLDSLEIWLTWALDEISYDWTEKNIPYDFESGPNDGKKVKGGYLWDMHVNAHGLEGWHEQMKDFGYEYTRNMYDKFDELGDVVFAVKKLEDFYDPTIQYVFGSMNVLKQLTFKNFINDAAAVVGDNEKLFEYRDKVCADFKDALEAKFIEVKKTPPNVMKLRKKREVVMSDGALDGLMGIDDEL